MPERAADRRGEGAGTTALGVVGSVLLVLLVVVSLVVIASRGEGRITPLRAAEPPDVTLSGEPESTPAADADADEIAVEEPPAHREPTEADAAAFSAAYTPPGGRAVESVVTDLDGDGRDEIVVASIAGDVVRLDVARWDGRAYGVVFTGQGGPAEELEGFDVRDVTGDGVREIITTQVTADRESVAMWGVAEGGVVPLTARGGCWNGSHVYGSSGVELSRGLLRATCPPDEDGSAGGTTAAYGWDGQSWAHEATEDG